MIRIYRDNKSGWAYLETVTEGYADNYLAWDSGINVISVRNINTEVEEINRIDFTLIQDKDYNFYTNKQELLDYLNNEVFISIERLSQYNYDLTDSQYYYYGYLYDNTSYKIVRVSTTDLTIIEIYIEDIDFFTDWNNRTNLNYT